MKELSIEQKATRYDEALERYKAKQEYEYQKVHEFIEYLFPELKESEDERIRKELLYYIQQEKNYIESQVKPENSPKLQFLIDAIAWLEKQKQQKNSTDRFFEGFRQGEQCVIEQPGKYGLQKQGEQILANSAKTCKDEQKTAEWEPQTGDTFRKKGTISPTYHLCNKREDGITFGFVENREVGICGGEITIFALRNDYELVKRPKSIEDVVEEELNKDLQAKVEHKPAIFIPKFRVGDKLVSTKNPRLTYEVLEVGHINELGNPEYKVEIFTDGKVSNPRNIHDMECYKVDEWAKQIEKNPTDKVEPKFKVGDEIKTTNGESLTITRIDRWGYWSEDLFICDFDDADKWELVEQKPVKWSEEDEKILSSIIEDCSYIGDFPDYPTKEEDELYSECLKKVDWLKSLRPRSHWKPTEKEMEAISIAVHDSHNRSYHTELYRLKLDLKKL